MDVKVGVLLLFVWLYSTDGQRPCEDIDLISTSISETDPPGTVIFVHNHTVTSIWSFSIGNHPQLFEYFALELNDTFDTFIINKTVDLEEIHEIWNIQLILLSINFKCIDGTTEINNRIHVEVDNVNEFVPRFVNVPPVLYVSEATSFDDVLLKLIDYAEDADVNAFRREIDSFSTTTLQTPGEIDGRNKFEIKDTVNGVVHVAQTLDYETETSYGLNVTVQDQGGLQNWTVILIQIQDADDQGPEFYHTGCIPGSCYTHYSADVSDDVTGPISYILPEEIKARDRDFMLNYTVLYTLLSTSPVKYFDYFNQNFTTGVVSITKPLSSVEEDVADIQIFLEARETSVTEYSVSTTFHIHIKGRITIPETSTPKGAFIGGNDDTLTIVLIVLGVSLGVITICFIFVSIAMRKRMKKNVAPGGSPRVSEGPTDVEEVTNDEKYSNPWPGMKSQEQVTLPRAEIIKRDLPPLRDIGTGTESQKKRSRRRKKEKTTEEYDGTQDYEGEVDEEFFSQKKTKIKQSSRSKETIDPKYWITVGNNDE